MPSSGQRPTAVEFKWGYHCKPCSRPSQRTHAILEEGTSCTEFSSQCLPLYGTSESSGVIIKSARVRVRESARACPSISLEFDVGRRRPAINAHLLQVLLYCTHDEFVR